MSTLDSDSDEEVVVLDHSLPSLPPSASEVDTASLTSSLAAPPPPPTPTTTSTSTSSKAKAFVPHTHASGCFEVLSSNNGNQRYHCLLKNTKNVECGWEGKHQSAKAHVEAEHTSADLSRFTGSKAVAKPLSQLGFTPKTQAQLDAERDCLPT
jgi:hypothetical protein